MSSRDDHGTLEPNLEDPEDLADRKALDDLDRYEPLDDLDTILEKRPRRFPVISFLIALLVSVAAGGGLWYLLGQGAENRPIPLVEADREQVKARPDRPGGLEVPHQEIAVLNQPAQETAAEPAPAEVLLPPPQVQLPVPDPPPPPVPADAPTPPTAAEAPVVSEPSPEPAPAAKTEIPPVPPLPPAPTAEAPSDAGPAAVEARKLAPPPLPETPPAPTPAEAPAEQTAVATPAAPPAAPAKRAADTKPSVPAASPPSAPASKTYRAQVASFREAARAEEKVAIMRRVHAELFGPLPLAVRRALSSGKTVHRVQAGAFAERGQANALCEELKRRGEKACFVTR